MKTDTIEPVSQKIRDDFAHYWANYIGPIVGWNGIGKAPTVDLMALQSRIWKLYRVAVTHEGVVE